MEWFKCSIRELYLSELSHVQGHSNVTALRLLTDSALCQGKAFMYTDSLVPILLSEHVCRCTFMLEWHFMTGKLLNNNHKFPAMSNPQYSTLSRRLLKMHCLTGPNARSMC